MPRSRDGCTRGLKLGPAAIDLAGPVRHVPRYMSAGRILASSASGPMTGGASELTAPFGLALEEGCKMPEGVLPLIN